MAEHSVTFTKVEKRSVINYLFSKYMGAKEIFDELTQTMANDCPSYSTVKSWVAEFRRGRKSTEDEERCGRPKTVVTPETVDRVHDMIIADRRIGLSRIAETLGISVERVHYIVHEELDMNKFSAKWVPKLFTTYQKRTRRDCAQSVLDRFSVSASNFIKQLVTVDETPLHVYDPET